MPAVVDEARVLAGEAHAAWSESFNEMFAQAAGRSPTRRCAGTGTGGLGVHRSQPGVRAGS
jgi:hypothetical protein